MQFYFCVYWFLSLGDLDVPSDQSILQSSHASTSTACPPDTLFEQSVKHDTTSNILVVSIPEETANMIISEESPGERTRKMMSNQMETVSQGKIRRILSTKGLIM